MSVFLYIPDFNIHKYKYKKIDGINNCFLTTEDLPENTTLFKKEIKEISLMSDSSEMVLEEEELEDLMYKEIWSFKGNNQTRINITVKRREKKNKKQELIEKLGEDFLPFIDGNVEMVETNRFSKRKLYKNVLSLDVCYWIINHFVKTKKPSLDVKDIPAVFDFMSFISTFILNRIQSDYEIMDLKLNLNIYEMFIVNYIPEFTIQKYDNSAFLTIQILLNDIVDFKEMEDSAIITPLFMGQGDILVSNCKTSRPIQIHSGSAFMLVILVGIV